MPYQAKYIKPTKIRELLTVGETKIRISGEAMDDVLRALDNAVAQEMKKIIDALPKITRGENKGKLKRITVKKEDVEKVAQEA